MTEQKLTQRETDTLNLVVKGYSNSEIAEELMVSIHTVKAHIESIYEKLCVHNKVQAAVYALQHNLVDIVF